AREPGRGRTTTGRGARNRARRGEGPRLGVSPPRAASEISQNGNFPGVKGLAALFPTASTGFSPYKQDLYTRPEGRFSPASSANPPWSAEKSLRTFSRRRSTRARV